MVFVCLDARSHWSFGIGGGLIRVVALTGFAVLWPLATLLCTVKAIILIIITKC